MFVHAYSFGLPEFDFSRMFLGTYNTGCFFNKNTNNKKAVTGHEVMVRKEKQSGSVSCLSDSPFASSRPVEAVQRL